MKYRKLSKIMFLILIFLTGKYKISASVPLSALHLEKQLNYSLKKRKIGTPEITVAMVSI